MIIIEQEIDWNSKKMQIKIVSSGLVVIKLGGIVTVFS